MTLRIENVITSGIFSLDGGSWEVDNNVWVIGDDKDVFIIDAAHDASPIISTVGNRNVLGIVVTHGHNDHITVAPKLSEKFDAPIYLHPGDRMLWDQVHSGTETVDLLDKQRLSIAGTELLTINTPGHSPGSICLHLPELGVLFSGDTLFQGGPGATGRSFSSFPDIIESIETRIFPLGEETKVFTGHGDSTTIGAEAPYLAEWIARGH